MENQYKPVHLLHGADYNPEQWLDRPDILAEDIRLMKDAGANCVSVGIFSWTALEPREGEYTFGWMADLLDSLHANGISAILATPSGARPAWMAQKYPEVLRVGPDGQRRHFGGRHNHCLTSPIYRDKVAAINQRLAESFGRHPAVILWHLSNEYSGECDCPLCQAAFRNWLREKYGTLDALNHAWWTAFWSHTFTDWDQIEPPFDNGEQELQGLLLDWRRFTTRQTVDFCAAEKAAVRAGGSDLPVTTNMMEFHFGLDYHQFAPVIDLASWDSYPRWTGRLDEDLRQAATTACFHDLMRCLKNRPFLLMESTPSCVNWRDVSKLKPPGMHPTEGLLAVAHGADSVQYFQWRKSRGGFEKFHGAVVSHDGRSDTRVFGEVAGLGRRLAKLDDVCGSMPKARVAVIYDWENAWALHYSSGPRNAGLRYNETVAAHYQALWRLGIAVDVIDADAPLDDYALVVAPMLYAQADTLAARLESYVRGGGTLVAGCLHGLVDLNDLCRLGDAPAGQTEIFGLRAEEVDALEDGEALTLQWQGKEYTATGICERLVLEGAGGLAEYGDGFWAGQPALTRHVYGTGAAYYLAAQPEDAFYTAFYAELAAALGLDGALNAELPEGVVACRRADIVFLQNFGREQATVKLARPATDWETGQIYHETVTLAGDETKLLC
jgi:beta-galactosidase